MLPLVLVPGMMCDARMWGALPTRLGGRPVHHILPVEAASMSKLAAEAQRLAPPRFVLAGLSLGGILAMEMLRQAPERIEWLALLDTNPLAEASEMQARRAPQIARAERFPTLRHSDVTRRRLRVVGLKNDLGLFGAGSPDGGCYR